MGSVSSVHDNRLRQLTESLRDSYTKQAITYDACRTLSINGRFFFEVAYQTMDAMIGITSKDTIHLDLPVGTGRFLLYLRDRGRRHQMIGMDVSPGMLQTCRRKTGRDSGTVSLAMGDAFSLPLADDSIDVVTSMRFFHLLPKTYWPAVLAEMHRVIRPGGFLIAEMRNLFRGIAGGLVVEYRDRWFRGGRHRSYIWPHQVHGLFHDWVGVETRGAGLDGLGRLSTIAPASARRLHGLTRYWPWRYIAKELFVIAYKRNF